MRARTCIMLAGLAALVLCGCPQEPATKAPPPTSTTKAPVTQPAAATPPPAAAGDATVEAGKRLYLTACVNCHGMDGTGSMMRQMMPNIGNLTDPATHARLDDAMLRQLILEGREKMPGFESVLKPTQVDQVIAYVRTLKHP